MKRLILASVMALLATAALAQEPPKFFQDTYPEHALKSALEARGVLRGEGAKLDAKTRELIGLGVSADTVHLLRLRPYKKREGEGCERGGNS